jgi:hypothetical protein
MVDEPTKDAPTHTERTIREEWEQIVICQGMLVERIDKLVARARVPDRMALMRLLAKGPEVGPKCAYCRDTGTMVVGGGRSGGGHVHQYITGPCTYCDAGRALTSGPSPK